MLKFLVADTNRKVINVSKNRGELNNSTTWYPNGIVVETKVTKEVTEILYIPIDR